MLSSSNACSYSFLHSIAMKWLIDLTISLEFIFPCTLEDTQQSLLHDLIVILFVDLYTQVKNNAIVHFVSLKGAGPHLF